jgi:predicted alpha/beta superfamily hydrolase
MKKISLAYLLCCSLFIVNGQNSNNINIGKIDSINSKILNEQRKIWIHVPEDNSNGLYEKKSYPVVYLLDGESHFYSVVGMLRQLSTSNGNTICPKMIVVGIPNTNRTRDLTPTKGKPGLWVNSNTIANSGGGESFMSFIQKELIPYINSNYPTQPYRMLIGHSYGGLTVMNTLIHQPNLFDAYVAIDPSMWWDDRSLLSKIKKNTFIEKYDKKKLFLGIANGMKEGMDISNVQKDTTNQTQHIRAILELNTFLNKDTQKRLSYKGKYYENDDHGSVPLITEYDAFRFIFDFYKFKTSPEEFLNPEYDFLNKIVNHFIKVSKELKTKVNPNAAFINSLGYHRINIKQFKQAEDFFKLNVSNYPKNYMVYDSLGDLYAVNGEKEKAIENYKKSISLNKDSVSKNKLIEFENKDSISMDRLMEITNE